MGAQIPDATVMAFQPPSLPGASSTGTLSLYLMNLGGEDVNTMGERANEFLAACRQASGNRYAVHYLEHQYSYVSV